MRWLLIQTSQKSLYKCLSPNQVGTKHIIRQMKMTMKQCFLYVASLLLLASCGSISLAGKSKNNTKGEQLASNGTKAYDRITSEATTQKGLFDVHQVGDKFYFEVADSLLNREILVVTRFIKTPSGARNYGGEKISENTIVFEKGPSNNLFLRIATLVSAAHEDDAISKAVNNSNITPILETFEIEPIMKKPIHT